MAFENNFLRYFHSNGYADQDFLIHMPTTVRGYVKRYEDLKLRKEFSSYPAAFVEGYLFAEIVASYSLGKLLRHVLWGLNSKYIMAQTLKN